MFKLYNIYTFLFNLLSSASQVYNQGICGYCQAFRMYMKDELARYNALYDDIGHVEIESFLTKDDIETKLIFSDNR